MARVPRIKYRQIDFDKKLDDILKRAKKAKKKRVVITAKELHDSVIRLNTTNNHRMTMASLALWKRAARQKNNIIYESPSGLSPKLKIEYII